MLTGFNLPEGELKVFVGLNTNISFLEDPVCWSSTTRKDAGFDDADHNLCGWTFAITVRGCGAATWLG